MPQARHVFLFALLPLCVNARSQDAIVQSIIDAVSIDSMMLDLGFLSGEAPIDIGNGPEVIFSRNKNQPGNPLAAAWLQQRFEQLGFTPLVQIFSAGTGENILVEKPGAVHPERKVVICGHYDSMPGGPVASPAADDDGSGTVAVLEALRVLADHEFENTIVFALWDEEEQGKLGSIYYAGVAAASDVEIIAAVNMDAISYDGDGDGLMRVHTREVANSIALKDTAMMVNQTYAGLQLPMAINLPGATYSDHASFWSENYSAILIIEDFDNDGNPHYHTSNDLVDHIDQPYFHGLARLSIGTTAAMARPMPEETAVDEASFQGLPPRLFVHPNPTTGNTTVRTDVLDSSASISLHDAMGRQVMDIASGPSATGKRVFGFDADRLVPGTYVLRLCANGRNTATMVVRTP